MRTTSRLLAIAASMLMLASAATSAQAETRDPIEELPVAQANPGVSSEIIDSLPPVVQKSDVGIAPDFVAGTPIVYPDGTPVEGQSPATMRKAAVAAASCSRTVTAPIGGGWSGASVCPVAVFGHPGYYRSYGWVRFSDTQGCVRVRGYHYEYEPVATWYSAGCGNQNTVSVYWGNVLGNPAASARSQSVATGWIAEWQS